MLTGACLDIGGEGLPYGPFLEVLRDLGQQLPPRELRELLGDVTPEIVAVAPGFARFLGTDDAATAASPGSPADQNRLFELMLALIDRLAADRPLILVLEDLHWSDPASSDLLVFLVRTLRRGRVLLIATFRTDDLAGGDALLVRLAELTRRPNVSRIELRPLDLAQQREMLTGMLGRSPATDIVKRIHARSEGNPFFTEELVAALDLKGSATDARDLAGEAARVPPSLRDILLGRLAGLSEDAQRVLRIAAVAGPLTDDPLLAEATGWSHEELEATVREAIARQILAVDERTSTYRFRHALLAEVVAAGLLPGERRRLHEEVATWQATAGPDGALRGSPSELAHHWFAAGRLREALVASIAASRAATAVYAHADALRQAERALDLWDRVPDARWCDGHESSRCLSPGGGGRRQHRQSQAALLSSGTARWRRLTSRPSRSQRRWSGPSLPTASGRPATAWPRWRSTRRRSRSSRLSRLRSSGPGS